MHAPDTVRYTPQIKDDYDGLDTPLQIGFFIFFSSLVLPILPYLIFSVVCRHKLFYSCHSNLRQAYLFCVFFFFIFDRKLGS